MNWKLVALIGLIALVALFVLGRLFFAPAILVQKPAIVFEGGAQCSDKGQGVEVWSAKSGPGNPQNCDLKVRWRGTPQCEARFAYNRRPTQTTGDRELTATIQDTQELTFYCDSAKPQEGRCTYKIEEVICKNLTGTRTYEELRSDPITVKCPDAETVWDTVTAGRTCNITVKFKGATDCTAILKDTSTPGQSPELDRTNAEEKLVTVQGTRSISGHCEAVGGASAGGDCQFQVVQVECPK